MAFTTAKTVANIQAVIGYSGTFFLYGSLCMLGTVYILFGVPETKGKTPEEILQYFKVGTRQSVHPEKLVGEVINMESQENDSLCQILESKGISK